MSFVNLVSHFLISSWLWIFITQCFMASDWNKIKPNPELAPAQPLLVIPYYCHLPGAVVNIIDINIILITDIKYLLACLSLSSFINFILFITTCLGLPQRQGRSSSYLSGCIYYYRYHTTTNNSYNKNIAAQIILSNSSRPANHQICWALSIVNIPYHIIGRNETN